MNYEQKQQDVHLTQTAVCGTEQHAYCARRVFTKAGEWQADSTYVEWVGLPGVLWCCRKSITTFIIWLVEQS